MMTGEGAVTGRKRTKKEYIVLSFASYDEAMEMESFCRAGQIPGRLIPLPPQVSAGCGLCWRMEPQEWEEASDCIRTQGPGFTGAHTVRLWSMREIDKIAYSKIVYRMNIGRSQSQ